MVRDLTPQGRIGELVVRGARMHRDVAAAVSTGTITTDITSVTSLEMTVIDPDLELLASRLFDTGAAIDYRGLKFSVVANEVTPQNGVPFLNVTARDLAVRKLRAQKGAKVWANTSAARVALIVGRLAGLTVVAQPSAKKRKIARGKKESSWAMLERLAGDIGYVRFVSEGVLYFGKPTWLLSRLKTVRQVTWNAEAGIGPENLVEPPTCRRSEDSKKNAAEVTLRLKGGDAEDWRAGQGLRLAGVPTFDGTYLVNRVQIPLDDQNAVEVSASTPENPSVPKKATTKPGSTGASGGKGPSAARFVQYAMAQVGDRYVYGAEASGSDADPDAFDCSELVEWALARCGVKFVDGSSNQRAYCQARGKLVNVSKAISTRGALLFAPGHVAISLGNGKIVHAKGRAYGVVTSSASGSGFTTGALVPGLKYGS